MTVQTKIKTKRYVIYALIIFLAHILQNTISIFPEIMSVRPVLLLSIAVCIAMFEGEIVGAAAGLLAGVLWDTVTVTADGYMTLYLTISCAICGILLRIFMRNNIATYFIVNSVALALFLVTYVLFFIAARGIDDSAAIFFTYYVPMGLYSFILTPLWYLLIRTVYRKFSVDYTEY